MLQGRSGRLPRLGQGAASTRRATKGICRLTSEIPNPEGWMGSGSTWLSHLPQALPRFWDALGRPSLLSISHCITIQLIILPTADWLRSLHFSTAALSFQVCTNSLFNTPSLYKKSV